MINDDDDNDEADDFVPNKPSWICQECGYEDLKKPMPIDRDKFYAKDDKGARCPKCKSKAMMPSGF